mmetsp:Transcript_4590/g.6975  ORF Transcript_4590/g.6975 Transcript_4590/m.6975 type:complete len:106 (-) Transcript_4590:1396-1713(-)
MNCEHCSLLWNRGQEQGQQHQTLFGHKYSFPSYESSVAWELCGNNLNQLYYTEPEEEEESTDEESEGEDSSGEKPNEPEEDTEEDRTDQTQGGGVNSGNSPAMMS